MTHVTCRLTAKNRDQLRYPTLPLLFTNDDQRKSDFHWVKRPITRLSSLLVGCTYMYRMGQESKLLILSEYVDKTEKTGGT